MANRTFIEREKRMRQEMEYLVPCTYATIAMALSEGNLDHDTIAHIFARSQEIWQTHEGNFVDMLIKCYNETGIQLMTQKQYDNAVKKGYITE